MLGLGLAGYGGYGGYGGCEGHGVMEVTGVKGG